MNRSLAIAFFALVSLPAAADSIELTMEEFKMYQHYKNAMEDPRVQKMKPESRLGAIAKDAGFKLKALQQAIEHGEAAGDVKALCERNIQDGLSKTQLSGRIGKIEVDTSDPHAVVYVQWMNENPDLLEEEASFAAATAQAGCPIVSTVQLWAQDKGNPTTRMFQGLISGSAAAKIKPERAKEFADTRYIRLFEKVKNAAQGDDLSQSSGTPQGKSGE